MSEIEIESETVDKYLKSRHEVSGMSWLIQNLIEGEKNSRSQGRYSLNHTTVREPGGGPWSRHSKEVL